MAKRHNKPFLEVDVNDLAAPARISEWVKQNGNPRKINFAGPRETTVPGVAAKVREILNNVDVFQPSQQPLVNWKTAADIDRHMKRLGIGPREIRRFRSHKKGSEWLSNMFDLRTIDDAGNLSQGIPYFDPVLQETVYLKSVEHGYHAAKTTDPVERRRLYDAEASPAARAKDPFASAKLVKRMGSKFKPEGWADRRLDVLKDLVMVKFSQPEGSYQKQGESGGVLDLGRMLREEPRKLQEHTRGFWEEAGGNVVEEVRMELNPDLLLTEKGLMPPEIIQQAVDSGELADWRKGGYLPEDIDKFKKEVLGIQFGPEADRARRDPVLTGAEQLADRIAHSSGIPSNVLTKMAQRLGFDKFPWPESLKDIADSILPEANTRIEMRDIKRGVIAGMPEPAAFISWGKDGETDVITLDVKELKKKFSEEAWKKPRTSRDRIDLSGGNISAIERDFQSFEEFFAFVVAHEKQHSLNRLSLPRVWDAEAGRPVPAGPQGERDAKNYENLINSMALMSLDEHMYGTLMRINQRQRRDIEREAEPKLDDNYLTLNVEAPTNIEFTKEDDPDWYLSEEHRAWVEETDAGKIKSILEDEKYADSVDALLAAYNRRNPDSKLSKEEYIEKFSDDIMSGGGMQQLNNMGILDTVARSVGTRIREQPTEVMLDMQTPEGINIVQALVGVGAIPASLRGGMQNLRSAYVEDLRTRFETIENIVEQELKGLRIPENIKVQFVDDIGGMFQTLSDVAMRGSITPREVAAMYDSVGNRIIINLAAVDPNNMLETSAIIRDSAFHEGLHSLFLRDYFLPAELEVLRNYVRSATVPSEVDTQAYDHDLTWFQRAIVKYGDKNIPENDIEYEAIISMLTELSRGKIPSAKSAGQMRKIKEGMQRVMGAFVGASKEAQIEDVNQILADIESGRIAERGPGYTGESEFDAEVHRIRDNILSRYADPSELKELGKAIALREAAPSAAQRAIHQDMVEQIAKRITSRKAEIQNSAPAAPSMTQNIEDERERAAVTREEPSFAVPLMGVDTKRDPEAYKEALNEFMRIRRGEVGYTMPAEYQAMFNERSQGSSVMQELTADAIERGVISRVDGDPTRKSLEKGALSGYGKAGDNVTGDTLEETQSNFGKAVSKMRYNYLDRRQWVKEQTDRIIAKQNRAQLDAETSALVAARQADNSVNYLRGLMLRGPLSYLGIGTGQGQFDNVPVFDEILAEQTGGDGRVKGLNEIFKPILDPKDMEQATLYGVAKRILWTEGRRETFRSMAEGIPRENLSSELRRSLDLFEESYTNITTGIKLSSKELANIVSQVENNNENQFILDFWNNFDAFNRHHVKLSYSTGMITRSQRDEWLGMPFTPFYRDMWEEGDFAMGTAAELQKRGKNLVEKALEGSRKPITSDLMGSILENTQALVRDAMANVSVSRTARDSVSLGEGEKLGNIGNLAGQVDNRVVRVMEKGRATFYKLADENLAMSAMMLGHNPRRQLQRLFGGEDTNLGRLGEFLTTGAATLVRESVTRTPPFIAKNIFRDGWQAMVITGGGPDLVLDSIRNAMTPDILRRADELGLSIGIDFVAEPGRYGAKMRAEIKKANPDWTNPMAPAATLWHFLGRIAKQSEVATRVAVYDRVLAKTGDKALAQYMAVEIMNYGRRGANQITGTIFSTIPFLNGRMQGLDVLSRAAIGAKSSSDIPGLDRYGLTMDQYQDLPYWKQSRGRLVQRGLQLSAATFFYYLLMRDNEEWQELRDEVRSDNWLLPLGEHAWLKIPIPFEVGVLFKVIPEKIFEAMLEDDVTLGDIGKETIRQLSQSLNIGHPAIYGPLTGVWRNYDKFRRQPIVDPWMEDTMDANEQRNRYTSNVARGVADLVNSIPLVRELDFLTSPMKMEYLMRQYLGTSGAYVIAMADRIARTGILPGVPFDPLLNLTEAENVVGTTHDFDWVSMIGGEGITNVPMLGDLLVDPRTRAGRQQDFYNLIKELDEVVSTLSSIEERDFKKAHKYADKHETILMWKSQLRFMERQMADWRKSRDFLADRPDLSIAQKRDRFENLLAVRLGILNNVDRILGEVRKNKSMLNKLKPRGRAG